MIALLVIDMQVGLFEADSPRYDAEGVIRHINEVSRAVRGAGGVVIFIQHEDGGSLRRETEAWEILPDLERKESDLTVSKQACDAFYETGLASLLEGHAVRQVIITGCATDFCVDTTTRAAASRDYEVIVVKDAHTTKDRPHLDARAIITHHNWMWENLILPHGEVKVMPTRSVVHWLQAQDKFEG